MRHTIGWIDDEIVQVSWCGEIRLEPTFCIDIYDWRACPQCGKLLKLRQITEVLEKDKESQP